MKRIIELAHRLVAPGPSASCVSASECHEIADFLVEQVPNLIHALEFTLANSHQPLSLENRLGFAAAKTALAEAKGEGTQVDGSVIVPPAIQEWNLCEQRQILFRPDVLIRFIVDPDCPACQEVAAEFKEKP